MAVPPTETFATVTRPLTDSEARELVARRESIEARSRRSNRDVVVVAIAIGVAMSGITLASSNAPRGLVVGAWSVIAAAIALWGARRARREFAHMSRRLTETIARDSAHVTHVGADAVVVIESPSGDARGFLFQVAGPNVLFIDATAVVSGDPFPSTQFAISEIRSPAGELVHTSVESTGAPLEPLAVVPDRIARRLRFPPHMTPTPGRIEDLEQLFEAHPAA